MAKAALGSLDIHFLVEELRNILLGARIQKIYQMEKAVHIELHVSGKGSATLILGGGRFYLSERKHKYPEKPSDFVMLLRKRLSGHHIRDIKQHEFDRIVILETDGPGLIGELLPRGNIVLIGEGKIVAAMEKQSWAGREIRPKEDYKLPPPRLNLMDLKAAQLPSLLAKEEKKVVVWLAEVFGGTYAEEICSRADVDKNKPARDLSEAEALRLKKAILNLFSAAVVPEVIFEAGAPSDVTPLPLKIYREREKKIFTSFNEAVDFYFAGFEALEVEMERKERMEEERAVIEKRRTAQEAALERLFRERGENVVKAQRITKDYLWLQDIVEKAGANLKLAKGLSDRIVAVDEKEKSVTINLGEPAVPVKIWLTKSLWDNVSWYYDQAKRAKEKVRGIEVAMAATKVEIEKLAAPAAEKPKETAPKKERAWYEKFRWFRSSEDFLVIAGKDATTNEIIIKKHTEPADIVLHADVAGSPFAVIKAEGKTLNQTTISEAAQFVACHSRAWRAGVGLAEVYWVRPEQVSKAAPSGEFLTRGAFMIYGKKNTLKLALDFAIGVSDGSIIAGPVNAVAAKTNKFVIVAPGNTKAQDLAKRIKARLFEKGDAAEKEFLRKLPIGEIGRYIPYGVGELKT